jgi:hypothetical protein
MKFIDYSFDEDYLKCEDIKVEIGLGEDANLLLKIGGMTPFSLLQMIMSWDTDVVAELIDELIKLNAARE